MLVFVSCKESKLRLCYNRIGRSQIVLSRVGDIAAVAIVEAIGAAPRARVVAMMGGYSLW